ncbi:MAG: helix-hairpin-helix domain-containing protein [Thermodesulfobacteriota bacterium]|nr:helix-hairpin-helix domain-containing protein [Thermodesulfobacteriota bacterium]
MRISEFKKVLKTYLFNSQLIPHSAFPARRTGALAGGRNPQLMKYFSLGQQKVLLVLAFFLLGVLYFNFSYSPPTPSEEITQEIVIEVLGEVRKPGVHIFQHSPTLKEAIEKAGGLKESGLFDKDSFSESLKTGTLLNVRKESQQEVRIKIETMEAHKLLVFNIPLDLNRVSMEDLCLIPGIGESLAKEIINYRERRRGFHSVEELKNVKGIGEKKCQSFKTFFIIRPNPHRFGTFFTVFRK